jgi:hypothetical protein
MSAPRDRCRSCGAEIVWCASRPGHHRIPVDPAPAADGVYLRTGPATVRVLGRAAREEACAAGTPLYLSHFATCPDAGRWRGTTRRALAAREANEDNGPGEAAQNGPGEPAKAAAGEAGG